MFWLCHKNKLSVYHLFVCVLGRGQGIFVTVDRLRHSRWVGESDEMQTCVFTSEAAKEKSMKDVSSFTKFNYNYSFSFSYVEAKPIWAH